MSYPIENNNRLDEIVLSSVMVAITLLVPLDFFVFLPLLAVILFAFFIYKERFVLVFTFITFLTVTTYISPVIRNILQVSNLILLGYYFLKHNGLDFKEYPPVPVPVLTYISTLLVLMFISSLNSNFSLGMEQVVRLIIFLAIIYFFYSLINHEKDYHLIVKSFYTIALIYSTYLIFEFASSGFNIIQLNVKTVTAIGNDYLNKNQMGAFFSIILTLTFSYFFYFKQKVVKILLSILLLFSLISMVLLNSRSAILIGIIGFVFVLFYSNRKLIKWVIISILLSTLLLLLDPIYQIFDIYFRIETISSGRDYILSAASNVIKDNWILGAGPAGTKFALYKNLPFMLNSPAEDFLRFHYNQIEFGHAHNFYMFFFSDLGIMGFILSLLLPVIFFKYGFLALKKIDKNSIDYFTLIGILGSGLSLFIRGLFEWGSLISYGTISLDLPFWLMFVVIIYLYTKVNEPAKKNKITIIS